MAMQNDADSIGSFISDERAAVETYRHVIERAEDESLKVQLRRIQQDHEDAARLLEGASADARRGAISSSGSWEGWSRSIVQTTQLFGERIALKALKVAEEHGIRDYESALRDASLDARLAILIDKRLLPRTRAHVPVLERFIETVGLRAEKLK